MSRSDDDGSGCLVLIVFTIALVVQCNRIDDLRYDVRQLEARDRAAEAYERGDR